MIEVLKQALEALNEYVDVVVSVNDPNDWRTVADGGKPARDAITSLRQAIAELESQEPVAIDWERIAKVQNAKLMAMCDEAGGFEKLCEVMNKYKATHPPQRTEPVAFKIYKPTPPRHAIPNVRDAELPWVYDQDPSSGNVASMWVTPVKHTHPPQRKEQEPVECDGDFPEGFDKSLDIPAQALRQANAALCEVTNNRMWDVPALAERMLMFCRNTHPPQRTWVGLSMEQFEHFTSYVRADVLIEIEEALMENNT